MNAMGPIARKNRWKKLLTLLVAAAFLAGVVDKVIRLPHADLLFGYRLPSVLCRQRWPHCATPNVNDTRPLLLAMDGAVTALEKVLNDSQAAGC